MRVSFKAFRSRIAGVILVLAPFGVTDAMADIAFTAPDGAPQTTNFGAANVNLGLVFTANSNFFVDALGVYYQGSTIPTSGSEMVGLFDHSGNLMVSTTVTFTAGAPGYQFTGITPVQLTGGDQYTVDAYTEGNSWAFGTTPTPNSRIAYDGSTYDYTNSLTFPTFTFFGPSTSYYGPNFDIGDGYAVAPEPGSYAALILAFGGTMLITRLRRAKQSE
jgi:hypothetical protein